MKKVVIVTMRQITGGSIVMHLLCKLLQQQGVNAKALYLERLPKTFDAQGCIHPDNYQSCPSKIAYILDFISLTLRDVIKRLLAKLPMRIKKLENSLFGYTYLPVKGVKRKWLPKVDDETIVVYPDIVYGNSLNAKNVVRWFLYHNRFENDKNAYGENDLFFCYREIFNDTRLNPLGRTLNLSNFDYDLYKQSNFGERAGKCYMIRKGASRQDLPSAFDGPVLDNLSEADIVKHFNTYKYCYFYDTQTFYTTIAAVCGCIPIVVMEPGKSVSDYMGGDDCKEHYGVAFGDTPEELQRAVDTRDKVMEGLKKLAFSNAQSAAYFIDECSRYFSE